MPPRQPRWPSDPPSLEPDDNVEPAAAETHTGSPLRRLAGPRAARWSATRTMETVLLASTAALLAAVAWPIASGSQDKAVDRPAQISVKTPASIAAVPLAAPPIQVALLLDTSSSMDGLLDQARSQLWSVVNALDSATFQGQAPRLQISIYEYGNDALSAESGYVRQVLPLSSELDRVSEALFSLTTAGGDEYAGAAIAAALDGLEWDDHPAALRVVYIAGNESFAQGAVDFRTSVARAQERGIVVNTVNCVGGGSGDLGWEEAARLGGGKAFRIDHNVKRVQVATPQDDEIYRLGTALNDTYVYYGDAGERSAVNQVTQDENSAEAGRASSITRALSKSSGYYDNARWDLVDALEQGTVDLPDLDRSTLPEELRWLSGDQLEAHVESKRAEREETRAKLRKLKNQRAAYLATHQDEDHPALDVAIIESLTEHAVAQGFRL